MAGKRGGLGKGLDSLIPNKKGSAADAEEAKKAVKSAAGKASVKNEKKEKEANKSSVGVQEVFVKLSKIEPDREQPRKEFNREALEELADSIKKYGIIQPIVVKKSGDFYQIIAGERRWRAAKLAGLKEAPVVVKDLGEQETLEISIIENIQRENLNPIEEAIAYQRLIDEFHLKQEAVAEKVSKSRVAITNSLRLLKLGDSIRQEIINGNLSMGHARALLAIKEEKIQEEICDKIKEEKLSVRETERYIANLKDESGDAKPKVKSNKAKDDRYKLVYKDMEEKLGEALGCNVKITQKTKKKGQIEIEYYSGADLTLLCNKILSVKNK